ncbi:lysophospholipid acyltransferase family protein [Neotamlana laminarinivorans]|uniref:Lysophospholipid acyltransferase family protein n=1 Tax=Neotamlana laminarinivorans TaxID=2883124 RepID=A0A9X1L0M8_9FLAO|nr:lysophospholipid acyltransferase family protein [Tamlana laminarinivorans]MCB4797923.1 lysophospholipid acyltransferase family protein [Tamlana laminarinivorans]
MQFLAYILVYPLLWIISILPFKLLYFVSDLLYILLYRVFAYRKKVVLNNLKLVFPDKSNPEIQRITKAFYHHLCDMIVEAIKSMTISELEMKKRFTFTNVELLQEIETQNRSVILMCAHYASWEWIFILQTLIKSRGNAVYKQLANKHFDKLVKRIRAKYNSYLVTTKDIIPTLIKEKKQGILSVNGFASDQSPKRNKAFHWQKFMGIEVPVHTGAEMLAKKLDMTVVFMKVTKLKRGFYQCTFKTITENPKDINNYGITDKFLKLVEEQITEAPEYYLWTHKRWKHARKH